MQQEISEQEVEKLLKKIGRDGVNRILSSNKCKITIPLNNFEDNLNFGKDLLRGKAVFLYNRGDLDSTEEFIEKKIKIQKTTWFDSNFKSKEFSEQNVILDEGSEYQIELIPVKKTVSHRVCYSYLRRNKYILIGFDGLMLLSDKFPATIPVKKYIHSFPRKYWRSNDGDLMHSYLYKRESGQRFGLTYKKASFDQDSILLCLSKK